MKFKILTKENLKRALNKNAQRAIDLLESHSLEDLEGLLGAEYQTAQTKSELLSLMYSEVVASNIQSRITEEDYDEEP